MEAENLKKAVAERYGEIAREGSSCCGGGCCGVETGAAMADSYAGREGYVPSADLGLGCGLPTEHADLRPGQIVVDLGSGAGNDAFLAAAAVGPQGKVVGVDMTPDMVAKARANARKAGADNVEFRLGEIEHLPLPEGFADRVLSNCVLNLVPDKAAAYRELFRVLTPGGRFSVSDIALEGEVPPSLREALGLYVGCVAGALDRETMRGLLEAAGFREVEFREEKPYPLAPEDVRPFLPQGFDPAEALRQVRVYKVTVTGVKPG